MGMDTEGVLAQDSSPQPQIPRILFHHVVVSQKTDECIKAFMHVMSIFESQERKESKHAVQCSAANGEESY